jgi:hypothetical protein
MHYIDVISRELKVKSLAWISCALAVAALAAPAAAQDQAEVSRSLGIAAPTPSETPAAQSEWYRQFTASRPADTLPQWQGETVPDFSMSFGNNRRWQFNLDKITRRGETFLPREEMQAGATLQLSPRLSVGGEVSIGADDSRDPARWEERDIEAGIRLRSAFRF